MDADPTPPLVTVAVACYNQGRFLGEAIESALGQTHGRVEVVVVDDGSTDDTPDVAARYPEVRTVRQPNAGLSAARNTGAREARGAFVVFLDADDRLRLDAVAAGLACFRDHPASAFVSGGYVCVASDGAPLAEPEPFARDVTPYLQLLRGNYIGMHAAVMYRRDVLLAAGGFDPSLPACEDYDLYLRLARDHPAASHEAVVAEYRIHDENMSHDASLMLPAVLRVLDRQREAVRGDPRREAAYRYGVSNWKAYYGRPLLDALRTTARTGTARRRAVRAARALAGHAPDVLLGAGRRLARRAAARALGAVPGGAALLRRRRGTTPPVGRVDFGDLRRTAPVSRVFGYDRGLPVDRHYIEGFLERHAADVRGRVLEVGDAAYTRRFGGARVDRADVLHAHADNPEATFVGDLTDPDVLPADTFDCVVLTQTLHLIYDVRAAVEVLYRALRPGGVLLATVPGISQIEEGEWGGTWHWGFTALSARRVMEEAFPTDAVAVEAHGNVLAAVAFLEGLAAEELTPGELSEMDPLYPLLLTVRAVKPGAST